ncbi:hypothetical protein D9M68_703210 [compost metagenome]
MLCRKTGPARRPAPVAVPGAAGAGASRCRHHAGGRAGAAGHRYRAAGRNRSGNFAVERQYDAGLAVRLARLPPDLGQACRAGGHRLCPPERLFCRHVDVERQRQVHRGRHGRMGPVCGLYRHRRRLRLCRTGLLLPLPGREAAVRADQIQLWRGSRIADLQVVQRQVLADLYAGLLRL